MKKNVNWKALVIFIFIVIVLGCIAYYLYNYGVKPDGFLSDTDIPTEPKHYDVNEYSNVLITDQTMCEKYLNDYKNIIYSDLRKAFDLLDKEYRDKKFGSYENFEAYINNKINSFSQIDRYYASGNKYYIYDKSNNLFIFSTKGVMTYKVYFDEDTVEITDYED